MNNANKKICLTVLCVFLLTGSVLADPMAQVTKKSAVIRQMPEPQGKVILTVKRGRELLLRSGGCRQGWCRVYANQTAGWISKSDVVIIDRDRFLKDSLD